MTTRIACLAAPVAVALALAVAGCGGTDESGAPATAAPTVAVKQIDGLGAVLVDDHGHALYTPDQEVDGKIRCANGCTTFWDPLTAGASAPTAAPDVTGRLAVVRRADGTRQVTYRGKPLYRFTEDPGPGQVTGDDFEDRFGGTTFTWHVVTTGRIAGSSGAGSQQRNGY